ncbi:MAG: c-type cytochrome [Omnitrophica WOR_2 bacterium]
MRKVLKWIGIILGGLVILVLLLAAGLVIYGQVSFKRAYSNRPLYQITADASPAGLARGKYLMENVTSCTGACHSEGGKPFGGYSEAFSQGPISVQFNVPNLTPDKETGLGSWSDAEIARAIREGIDKDGRGLVVMPAFHYHALSDADVAAMIGYLRQVQPVRNQVPSFQANAVAKIMLAMGMFGPKSVGAPITSAQQSPPVGTPEYGSYMVTISGCNGCHGESLSGNKGGLGRDPAPNLTPGGELAKWSEADFITALRTGNTPSGIQLSENMPWKEYGQMTDEDLKAIFLYLKSLPATQFAQ